MVPTLAVIATRRHLVGLHGWPKICYALLLASVAIILSPPLQAVIFYSTSDPNYNTTPPTGALANSGWQWVGKWGGFQGTPIGPHHFIAAHHVGGAVDDPFVLDGVAYTTMAFFDDTVSDLRIWQVDGTFPSWAPLYRANNEVGKRLVVFGRGLTRGAEVRDAATNTLRGWHWGAGDGKMRWGQNAVVAVVNGGNYWGVLLYAVFNASGGPDVAHLAQGDSSGPVFIHDGTGWKLAGVAASVDSAFNITNTGAGFNAAIFDRRGLYYGKSENWRLVSGALPVPSGFYATRISVRLSWIDSVISPVPTGGSSQFLPRTPEGGTKPAVTERRSAIEDTGWRPSPRYQLMLTLAALGNARKQFQLGTALLQESDDAAKTEGFKWLEASAAQGYHDAVALLAQGRDQLVRPERDRDNFRVTCCRPAPGR